MSYDISLCDPVTGEVLELETPHHMRGGTYAMGGTTKAHLNVTYNYSKHYSQRFTARKVTSQLVAKRGGWGMGEELGGIRSIYGMTGAESIPALQAVISKLGDDVTDDYWEATEGNAKRALSHPELAYRLNQVLAHLHPMAIPAEFRTKPKKRAKEFQMMGRPLPFAVLAILQSFTRAKNADTWAFSHSENKAAMKQACAVVEAIGGVPTSGLYQFDYDPGPALAHIVTSGCIPDQQAHQYYPTPADVAERAVEWADIGPNDKCLEPSAGQGGLADRMPKDRTLCVEISPLHCEILRAKGYDVVQADFLTWAEQAMREGQTFSRIVMNPPFSEGRAKLHTEQAFSLLAPGGVLVSVLPSGMRNKPFLAGADVEWSQVLENKFDGTTVDVVLMRATPMEQT